MTITIAMRWRFWY